MQAAARQIQIPNHLATRSRPQLVRNSSLRRVGISPSEIVVQYVLGFFASISILTTIGIVIVLGYESVEFFSNISWIEFLTSKHWNPLIEPREFGILPLISGTMMVGVGAMVFAVPLGLGIAILLNEYLPFRLREFFKATVEILAGIPTVVYGYFAVSFITPHLKTIFPTIEIFNALSATIVVGIMVIPTIASLSQDALRMVPRELRDAAFGLGARKYSIILRVVFPSALSGIVASVLLAFSRAIGETMAVALAAGATPRMALNPLESIQTMTSYIVQVSLGDSPAGSIEYQSIFAVGLVLFVMTLISNLVAQRIVRRFQEKYS